MTEAVKDPNCLVATSQNNMLGRLKDANNLLEEIQKGEQCIHSTHMAHSYFSANLRA
jgi:hypothetical protein